MLDPQNFQELTEKSCEMIMQGLENRNKPHCGHFQISLILILIHTQICPARPANFLALWVWEGAEAIQNDKYLK